MMIEKRAMKRYLTQRDRYFVLASGIGDNLGTIIDISQCGLSFFYPPEAIMYEENDKLDIVHEEKGIILENIAYQNCYDFEMPQSIQLSANRFRRRGVKFKNSICDITQIEQYFDIQSLSKLG
jgi:hypothetical protein